MKKMIATLGIGLSSVFAAEGELKENFANIHRGDWSVSSSYLQLQRYEGDLYGRFNLSASYYVMDRLSFGLDTSMDFSEDRIYGLIGPSAQFDFLQLDKFVFYSKVGLQTYVGPSINAFDHYNLKGDLGMDFYVNRYFSLGPYVEVNKLLKEGAPAVVSVSGRVAVHF